MLVGGICLVSSDCSSAPDGPKKVKTRRQRDLRLSAVN